MSGSTVCQQPARTENHASAESARRPPGDETGKRAGIPDAVKARFSRRMITALHRRKYSRARTMRFPRSCRCARHTGKKIHKRTGKRLSGGLSFAVKPFGFETLPPGAAPAQVCRSGEPGGTDNRGGEGLSGFPVESSGLGRFGLTDALPQTILSAVAFALQFLFPFNLLVGHKALLDANMRSLVYLLRAFVKSVSLLS